VLAALAGCGGYGDDGDDGDPAALKSRLVPASEVSGYKLHRTFEWDDSIDLVAQGIPMSETTAPSGAVEVMEDAGFEAGAGEHLTKEAGADISFLVAKFASADDARDVQEYVYREGLKLPCYASCTQVPGDMPVSGIPGAKGVEQLPKDGAQAPETGEGSSDGPPSEPPPFVAYGVGFTVGEDFYLVSGGGAPGTFEKDEVIALARRYYRRVSDEAAS
jgi:hypothetical protein